MKTSIKSSKRGIGRPREITVDVVKRIAKRFGQGLPLKEALALERNPRINPDSWHKAIQRHSDMSALWDAAKADFLAKSIRRLAESKDLRHLCWLLERRFPEMFGRPAQVAVNVSQSTAVGLPDDVLARARQYAQQNASKDASTTVPANPAVAGISNETIERARNYAKTAEHN